MKTTIISPHGSYVDISKFIPDGTTKIITGGSNAIDRAAEAYADEKNIPKLIIKPEYNKYGRVAPLKRNKVMIKLSDMVVVIWDRRSYIVKHAVDYALKINKPMRIYLRPYTKK